MQVCAGSTTASNHAAIRALLESAARIRPLSATDLPAMTGDADSGADSHAVEPFYRTREPCTLAMHDDRGSDLTSDDMYSWLQREVDKTEAARHGLRTELATARAQLSEAHAAVASAMAERDAARKTADDQATANAGLQTRVRELEAAAAAAPPRGGAGGGAVKPSLVDCELHADAITFERNRKGDRVKIGRGAFGDVYAATFGAQPCVAKVINLPPGMSTVPPHMLAAFWRETTTQFLLRHPHIVTLHGGYADVGGGVVEVGAVMERCSGGTLEAALHGVVHDGAVVQAPRSATVQQRLTWAHQTMSALA